MNSRFKSKHWEAPTYAPAHTGVLQRKCACGSSPGISGECDSCRENRLRRSEVPQVVRDVLHSPGHPLDAPAQSFFAGRFGHDFSHIRVHADSVASVSAASIGARAYTVGNHIAFAGGQYSPNSVDGRRLLAHELTHAVQQQGGGASQLQVVDSAMHEREADQASDAIHSGGMIPSPTLQSRHIAARDKDTAVKTCAKTHTIPDDVYTAIDAAWKKSGHGGDVVTEQGGRIVTDKTGKRVIRTSTGGGGSISLPNEEAGDVTTGTFHTHPYSKAEDSELGVSFSGADIKNFVAGGQGSVKYIGAGSCYFVLDTLDQTKKDACKKEDLVKRWDDAFAGATGSFQAQTETAVAATIAGCGLCYYKACQPDKKSAVPKTAKLV